MYRAAMILWVLNAWDAVATWRAVILTHTAVEVNPFMSKLLDTGIVPFFTIKIGFMTAATLGMLAMRRRNPVLVKAGLALLLCVYACVGAYQVYGILS